MNRNSGLAVLFVLSMVLPIFGRRVASDATTRVQYQRAIEQVYWAHRIWPEQNSAAKPALDAVIAPEQVQAKAENTLRLSAALETLWHAPITGPQLQAEMVRMAQHTHQPELLRELFAALGNDPRAIAEVLARSTLAERLARNFYQQDFRFSASKQPFDTWWSKTNATFAGPLAEPDFNYSLPQIEEASATESWSPTFALPDGDSGMSAVWTGTEMIIWGGGNLPQFNTGSRYNPATDTWVPTNAAFAPVGKSQHTAVWTGKEMIVWGGCDQPLPEHACASSDGSRYNPATDTWTPTTLAGVPGPRLGHTAVWTGKEMIVWGGCSFINDACRASQVGSAGGRYDPLADTWTPTNISNAPVARTVHTTVWTGNRMIVWGGFDDNEALKSGGVYNPTSDSWTATAEEPNTFARYFHTAVWTGREMIVWGGSNGLRVTSSGARYNPATNKWHLLPSAGAPSPRGLQAAVWTGNEMVVWGGSDGVHFPNTGGRFNPSTNTWRPTSTQNAPVGRSGQPATVWTGALMIVWGGFNRTGGRYNPVADSWTPTNSKEPPQGRNFHTGVWTGTEMIVWGGNGHVLGDNTGGRYDPATDSWLPTTLQRAPSGRALHSALWTGTEMIVFGGASGNIVFKTGGRYNPATNSWKATNSQTAPVARSAHAAVWTGAEMIVFGGSGNAGWLNSGGRYNPATDSWLATPTNSAPTPRELPAAVWTGNEMIVWGGATANFDTNTGARFNPSTNTWKPTSLNNAPSARNWTAALWTGSRMLIWGGQTYSGVYNYHNDGALYDPATDTWTPTSMTNAPSPRAFFGYVWTGTEMIAWSGCSSEGGFCSTPTITGGRYDPNIDAWRETTTVRVPAGRYEFPAAWTGDKMIVWGGIHEHLQILPSGGVYTPGP